MSWRLNGINCIRIRTSAWIQLVVGTFVLCSMLAHVCTAGIVITESENWDSGGNTAGWSSSSGYAVDSPSSGGNPAGLLRLVDGVFGPDDLYTSSTFIGNYSEHPSMFLSFDMRVTAANPRFLFFESSAGSRWQYTLTGPANVWSSYNISFADSAGWDWVWGPGSFEDALTNVIAVGFTVQNGFTSAEYDIDNFRRGYMVPEPSAIYAILASFCSFGITFRKRLSASVVHLLRSAQKAG